MNYEYNPDNLQVKKVTFRDSEQNVRATTYKYPTDYKNYNLQSSPVNKMQASHIINPVIEKKTFITQEGIEKLLTAELTDFQIMRDLVVPSEILTFKSNDGTSNF